MFSIARSVGASSSSPKRSTRQTSLSLARPRSTSSMSLPGRGAATATESHARVPCQNADEQRTRKTNRRCSRSLIAAAVSDTSSQRNPPTKRRCDSFSTITRRSRRPSLRIDFGPMSHLTMTRGSTEKQ